MQSIVVSSNSENDIELIINFAKRIGLKVKVFSDEDQEDIALLNAMLEADRSETIDESIILNKLKSK